MRVLVTGCNGYIGSVLSAMLRDRGDTVFGVDNNLHAVDPPNMFLRKFKTSFEHQYIVDSLLMYGIDKIVHLAASSTVGPDATDPITYYCNNTGNTATFLKRLTQAGWAGHFVFASTAAVYGGAGEPLLESDPVDPQNTYGKSKLYCEYIINSLQQQYNINHTTFRFFNVAGAYNEFGEEAEDTHLLSRICSSAVNGNTLNVYGDDYPTYDGTCIRDYVDVRDICRAIMFSMDNEAFGTYNLGTEQGTSVTEMIARFMMLTNQQITLKVADRRQGDAPYLVACPHEFKRRGFEYKYTIDDIINSSWEYFKNGI